MTYLSSRNMLAKVNRRLWIYDWLPGFAWSLIPLSVSIFTQFGKSPSWSQDGRWLGLLLLMIYGLFQLVLRGKWHLTIFDYLAMIIFGLIFLISIAFSSTSLGIYKALSCLLVYLYLTWGTASLVNTFDEVVVITEKFFLVAITLLSIGLVGNIVGFIPPIRGGYSGISFNPNGIASLAILFFPLSAWFLLTKKKLRVLKYIPITVILIVVLLSEARTPWIALFAFLFYYGLCWMRYRRMNINQMIGYSLLSIGLIMVAFIFWSNTSNFRSFSGNLLQSLQDTSGGISSFRTSVIWPLYLDEIGKSITSLMFGHGWASEELFLVQRRAIDPSLSIVNAGTAHSAYIGLTYQIGLIGSVLTFGSLWILVLRNIRDSFRQVTRAKFYFKLAIFGSILMALCVAFFETGMYNMGAMHAVPTWFFVYIATRIKLLDNNKNYKI